MASASTSTSVNSCYQVFLNHRGPDTKLNFSSHLYHRLVLHGLRVFWDKKEMQVGDSLTSQIHDAIQTSSIHVAVFSPRYAESSWCLNELHLMVESGKPIIPVFHGVRPTEVRQTHGGGVYAKALRSLEKKRTNDSEPRYDSTTIEMWRKALSTVAEKSGLELDMFNGDEGELLDKVIDSVFQKLGRPRFDVAEYPTGLKEKIEDFENTVLLVQRQQSGKPHVIGIVGLGGIGKTTFAKELSNTKSSKYSRSCFLLDVRENARRASLELLQKKLLKGLTQRDEEIGSVSEGIVLLKTRLLSLEALVILDDVDHINQLDALLRPIRDVLHSNSLILITSRDRDVLRMSRVEESSIYKLTGLNPQQSQELFCLHAFTQRHPLVGFEDLVDKYLKACNGLPLSLKVFGGLLYGNHEKSFWKDHLERLEQTLPYDIKKSLQISYDALQIDEKQIFLDIACFFIGKSRDTAIRIWDGCGWKGSLVFRSLQNKNLVEVEEFTMTSVTWEAVIWMHDHLRDLGRDLANDPILPRRIWRTEDFYNFMQESSVATEVTEVRGISLLWTKNEDPLFSVRKMKNLQLLHIDTGEYYQYEPEHLANDPLKSILDGVQAPNLIWFSWKGKSCHSSLPSSVPMNKLRVLELEWVIWEALWQEESQALLQLQELRINSSTIKYLPEDYGNLRNLQYIKISDMLLGPIPDSFGSLSNLQFLDIYSDFGFPDSFANLTNLQHISLLTWKESIPDFFGHLTKLQGIDLRSNMYLKKLPESFERLTNLQRISLSGCQNLKRLPESFRNLTNLQNIQLVFYKNLERLPESFGNLRNLQNINLSRCENLKRLPESFGNLTNLHHINLSWCRNLERLPDSFGNLTGLRILILSHCIDLTMSRKTLGNICTLEEIDLTGCNSIGVLPSQLAHQRSLETLNLWDLENLIELPSNIEDLKNLKNLNLRNCHRLKNLPDSLGRLNQLTELAINNCSICRLPFKMVEGEQSTCPNLQGLDITHCEDLVEVGALPNALTKLVLADCPELSKIEWVSPLSKLQMLKLSGCIKVEQFPSMETLVSLEELDAGGCVKLRSIWGLAHLTKLQRLVVFGCSELEELVGVEHLRSLELLDATGCVKLRSISGLAHLTKLSVLEVLQCSELEQLESVEHLR